MKQIVALFIATVLFMPCAAEEHSANSRSNGTEVLKACGITLDLKVYHPHKVRNKREAYGVGYCLGLVQGVYANASGSYFCPPDDVKAAHVMDLVVRFVKEHPNLEQKDAADIVRWALSDEYPCKNDGSADPRPQSN